jgi:hypothetical protein
VTSIIAVFAAGAGEASAAGATFGVSVLNDSLAIVIAYSAVTAPTPRSASFALGAADAWTARRSACFFR